MHNSAMVNKYSHRYCDAACCLMGELMTGAASLDGVYIYRAVTSGARFPATPPGGGGEGYMKKCTMRI